MVKVMRLLSDVVVTHHALVRYKIKRILILQIDVQLDLDGYFPRVFRFFSISDFLGRYWPSGGPATCVRKRYIPW